MSINVWDEERQETSQLTPMTKEELITGSLSNREISQGQKTVNETLQISAKSLFSIFQVLEKVLDLALLRVTDVTIL